MSQQGPLALSDKPRYSSLKALRDAGFRLVGAPMGREHTPPAPGMFAEMTPAKLGALREELFHLTGFLDPHDTLAQIKTAVDLAACEKALALAESGLERIAIAMDEDGVFYACY